MSQIDQLLIDFHWIQYLVIYKFEGDERLPNHENSAPRLFCIHNYWGANDEDENWFASLYHHRLDRWEIAEGVSEARNGER